MKRILSLLIVLIFAFSSVANVFAVTDTGAAAEEDSEIIAEEPETYPLEAPELTALQVPEGFALTWSQVEDADGYYVYYQYTDTGKWFKYTTKTSPSSIKSIFNISRKYGKFNFYIEAFNDLGGTSKSEIISEYWLRPVTLTSTLRQQNSLYIAWEPSDHAEGYEIECCENRFFTDPYVQEVYSVSPCEVTFAELSGTEQYYARVRAYYTADNGDVIYSPWTYSDNAITTVNASIKRLSYNGTKLELRGGANQKVGYYDTLQGGCYADGYGYFVLYNRNIEKCKIAKFDLSTGKKVKVSAILPISHGNDLTYNPDRNIIVAVHSTENGKKVSIIDPDTLKIKSTKIIRLDEKLPGMSESRRSSFKGIGAIAYNEYHQQYVARIKTLNDLLFLDSNLNPVRYARLTKEDKQIFQGMDTAGDYVLVGQSFKTGSDWNLISIYDWSGTYVSKVNIKKGYELECLFHDEDTFYAGFYRSYYQTYYKTAFKTVKVKNKNGKYVKKLVKYQQKKKRLMRDNYIYSMDKI